MKNRTLRHRQHQAAQRICPTCTRRGLALHCITSATCDVFVCPACKTMITDDGHIHVPPMRELDG